MRRRDANYLTMVNTTLAVLIANNTKWAGKPPIADMVEAIMDGVAAISGAAGCRRCGK